MNNRYQHGVKYEFKMSKTRPLFPFSQLCSVCKRHNTNKHLSTNKCFGRKPQQVHKRKPSLMGVASKHKRYKHAY